MILMILYLNTIQWGFYCFTTPKDTLLLGFWLLNQPFYKEALIPRYYPHVIETILKHKANGVKIWLVSASPEPYLFCTDLPVDKIIGTQVARENDHWTNHIISKNCKSEEKVRRIKEELEKLGQTIDYENSYGYSDSDSDYPMLQLVKHRYRIDKKTSEIKPFIYRKC